MTNPPGLVMTFSLCWYHLSMSTPFSLIILTLIYIYMAPPFLLNFHQTCLWTNLAADSSRFPLSFGISRYDFTGNPTLSVIPLLNPRFAISSKPFAECNSNHLWFWPNDRKLTSWGHMYPGIRVDSRCPYPLFVRTFQSQIQVLSPLPGSDSWTN